MPHSVPVAGRRTQKLHLLIRPQALLAFPLWKQQEVQENKSCGATLLQFVTTPNQISNKEEYAS